jgi:hypothetical protein
MFCYGSQKATITPLVNLFFGGEFSQHCNVIAQASAQVECSDQEQGEFSPVG